MPRLSECPHCRETLTETQLKKLWAEYCGAKKSRAKSTAARRNGAKGGRPMSYLQSMYASVPESIVLFHERLKRENARHQFPIVRVHSEDPCESGFDLICDGIQWHCFWDGISDFISISENGKPREGINRVNYSASRAALKLVQDIHRSVLMRMPEDNSDIVAWIEKRGGTPFKPKS